MCYNASGHSARIPRDQTVGVVCSPRHVEAAKANGWVQLIHRNFGPNNVNAHASLRVRIGRKKKHGCARTHRFKESRVQSVEQSRPTARTMHKQRHPGTTVGTLASKRSPCLGCTGSTSSSSRRTRWWPPWLCEARMKGRGCEPAAVSPATRSRKL